MTTLPIVNNVLIVDDNQIMCKLISDILTRDGYSCISVNSVDGALSALYKDTFPLVISDINMPEKSGIDLLNNIATQYTDTAIIMVTAVDERNVGIDALEKGASAYLIKPFGKNELLINVSSALRQRELEIANKRYNLELEGLVHERTLKLKLAEQETRESQEETIDCLARAAEFRDDETALHTIRMGHYCYILARRLNLSEFFCERMRLASPLHDVGKIGISDTILLKPGKLTKDEFEIIKTHTNIGYRILSDSKSKLLSLGASIAISHHEKYDGTGYPNGLSGEKIPIEGRIAAVCDVFDALTSNRVYKKAMSVGKAIKIIKDGRGKHFDPKLVDLFLDSIDEILNMKEKFADKPSDLE